MCWLTKAWPSTTSVMVTVTDSCGVIAGSVQLVPDPAWAPSTVIDAALMPVGKVSLTAPAAEISPPSLRTVSLMPPDPPAVEVVPGDPAVGSLHRRLLPTLGTALGEMFDLERLAAACRHDGRATFLFVAAPLHLPDGLGSPGNAVAIR